MSRGTTAVVEEDPMSEDRDAAPRGAVRSGDVDGHAASGSDRVAPPGRTDTGRTDTDTDTDTDRPSGTCSSARGSAGPDLAGPDSEGPDPGGPDPDCAAADHCGPDHCDAAHSDSDSGDTASSHEPPPQAPRTLGARAAVAAVRWYQVWISPNLLPSCRFMPSCSAYAVEALTVHGAIRGIGLTVWRLLRCAPWHPGGWDPVPPPRGPGRSGPEPGAADPAPTDPSRTEGL